MAYTRDQAWALLTEFNEGDFHLKHALTVGDVMRWFAEKLGYGTKSYKLVSLDGNEPPSTKRVD